MKHGYKSVEEFKAGVQKKFSLLENDVLDTPSTRLLLINVSSFPSTYDFGTSMHVKILTDNTEIGYPRWSDAH